MKIDGSVFVGGEKISVFVVVVHKLLRKVIRQLIEASPHLAFCGEASSSKQIFKKIESCLLKPEVLLFDVYNPNVDIAFIPRLRELYPDIQILGISGHYEREYIRRALTAGVNGYLMKDEISVDLLPEAIFHLKMGTAFISPKAKALLDRF